MKTGRATTFFMGCLMAGLMALSFGCTKDKGKTEGEVKSPQADDERGGKENTAVDETTKSEGEKQTRPRGRVTAAAGSYNPKGPKVKIVTSMGDIVVQLDPEKAPISTKNFLRYVKEGHYNGTIFHRVISNFMIQGGGFTPDFKKKSTHDPIKNEATNGVKNLRGTVSMARTMVVDSATAQFFINVKDNASLNHRGPGRRYGYAVFGKVVQGMDVVDKIKSVPTGPKGPFPKDAPQTTVLIKKVKLMGGGEEATDTKEEAKKDPATKEKEAEADKTVSKKKRSTRKKAMARSSSRPARPTRPQ